MKTLSIDIETYSATNLAKAGVYKYCEDSDFEILLFGYSADGGPVHVVDLAAGESLPADVLSALTDPSVLKTAFNAQFERVCLSRFLGYPTGTYLDPSSWHCTMVWAATLGLPLSLEGVGAVLGLEKQKLKEGKDLIRYFCTPAKTRDCSYPHAAEVHDEESLAAAVRFDYVAVEYKNGYRNNANFIQTNCLVLDCDNDHSEDSAEWITPQQLRDALPDVTFTGKR